MNYSEEEIKAVIAELIKDKIDKSDIVVLTPEEIKYVKELISDRKAMGRVLSRGKVLILAILGLIVALTDSISKLLDLFWKWMAT